MPKLKNVYKKASRKKAPQPIINNFNPLKDIRWKKKEGWQIGPIRVLLPINHHDKKKIRNIIVSEKKIKALVFGNGK